MLRASSSLRPVWCCCRSSDAIFRCSSASFCVPPITWPMVRRASSSRRNIQDSRPRLSACCLEPFRRLVPRSGAAGRGSSGSARRARRRCGRRPDRACPSTLEIRWFHAWRAAVQRFAGDGVLEALVGGERQQIAELEPGAEHPEAGIGDPEQPEGRQPDPVRRDEHADRPRVEGRGQVIEEPRLRGHRAVIITRLRGEWRRGSTNAAGVRRAASGGRRVSRSR